MTDTVRAGEPAEPGAPGAPGDPGAPGAPGAPAAPGAADAPVGASARRRESGVALLQSFVVAIVAGAGLVLTARAGAVALLAAIAVVQAVFAVSWVFGTAMPGRWGGLVIAALASAGADAAVMVRPHERLGVLLTVLGLTIPAIYVHQLLRGAARVQVVASMAAVAVLAVAEVAVASLVQIRHEFIPSDLGGTVAATAAAALAGSLAVGYLVDTVVASPRFDAEVDRGLPAIVVSAAVGAALGYLMLRGEHQFPGARAAFFGGALGALAGLLGVALAFVLHTTSARGSATAGRLRPAVAALAPIMVLSPAAFLLCLAIRA